MGAKARVQEKTKIILTQRRENPYSLVFKRINEAREADREYMFCPMCGTAIYVSPIPERRRGKQIIAYCPKNCFTAYE